MKKRVLLWFIALSPMSTGAMEKKDYNLGKILTGSLNLDDINPESLPEYLSEIDAINLTTLPVEDFKAFLAHPTTQIFATLQNVANKRGLIHYLAYGARIISNKKVPEYFEKIAALVTAGSDLTGVDSEGKTPLTIYTEEKYGFEGGNNPEIIALLTPIPLEDRIVNLAQTLSTLHEKIGPA